MNHPHNYTDITGRKFGRLKAVLYLGNRVWLFKCDCGKSKKAAKHHVTCGDIRSCGCLLSECRKTNNKTHGMSKTKVYRAWVAMLTRCYNKNNHKYKSYGGRGIRVCRRWAKSFTSFLADMGLPPSQNHSVGRINNDGNYTPKNCRWETNTEQARNTRRNRFIEFAGERRLLQEWSEITNLRPYTISERIRRGWKIKDALFMKKLNGGNYKKLYSVIN